MGHLSAGIKGSFCFRLSQECILQIINVFCLDKFNQDSCTSWSRTRLQIFLSIHDEEQDCRYFYQFMMKNKTAVISINSWSRTRLQLFLSIHDQEQDCRYFYQFMIKTRLQLFLSVH